MNLSHRVIAVVAGDEREQEIARLAVGTGAVVRAYGFPWPEEGIKDVRLAASAAEALDGADYALFPIPGLGPDGELFAPASPMVIRPDHQLLERMNGGASIILGSADGGLREVAGSLYLSLIEYEHDTELMLLRGPAIVEGALGLIIANTDVTVHDSVVGVVGYGTVGRLLTRTLVLLGARVHVFARNGIQRADAFVAGATPHPLTELQRVLPTVAMLFCTVPAAVVSAELLSRLPPRSLVMDLAAPPGGIDLRAAEALGHRALWARGLGRRAPVTVGRSQWSGIWRHIEAIERKRIHAG